MTNAQINLQIAVKALEAGKLSKMESVFIEEIKMYDKKQLRSLTKKTV